MRHASSKPGLRVLVTVADPHERALVVWLLGHDPRVAPLGARGALAGPAVVVIAHHDAPYLRAAAAAAGAAWVRITADGCSDEGDLAERVLTAAGLAGAATAGATPGPGPGPAGPPPP
ncbi:MAG TPA: hypothetical protein VFP61_14100 [Acidimicrobiales bacterium]|nr:hypothetical protein [Acidimicrobiales bacterium]